MDRTTIAGNACSCAVIPLRHAQYLCRYTGCAAQGFSRAKARIHTPTVPLQETSPGGPYSGFGNHQTDEFSSTHTCKVMPLYREAMLSWVLAVS